MDKIRREKKNGRLLWLTAIFMILLTASGIRVRAQEETGQTVFLQMPGFVLEQWSPTRQMTVTRNAPVYERPDPQSAVLGSVAQGQYLDAWGQTDTGWYFVAYNGVVGYIRYEAACFLTAPQQESPAFLETEAAGAPNQSTAGAGVVLIGDSRMVTLQAAVERRFGFCPVTVVAQNGGRHEWLHDTGIPQADKVIGKGTRVLINMGVNDLSYVEQYAQDVNAWAAAWIARGATVYYASVNPVWSNVYEITQERVDLFNAALRAKLIPQIVWLDSSSYLKQHGFVSMDGLHYQDETNLLLYQYYMAGMGLA